MGARGGLGGASIGEAWEGGPGSRWGGRGCVVELRVVGGAWGGRPLGCALSPSPLTLGRVGEGRVGGYWPGRAATSWEGWEGRRWVGCTRVGVGNGRLPASCDGLVGRGGGGVALRGGCGWPGGTRRRGVAWVGVRGVWRGWRPGWVVQTLPRWAPRFSHGWAALAPGCPHCRFRLPPPWPPDLGSATYWQRLPRLNGPAGRLGGGASRLDPAWPHHVGQGIERLSKRAYVRPEVQ